MANHEIVSTAFQKYYSALKSLDEFGCKGDFFDDVSSLDKFFSEFRNITFVIQKHLENEENKSIYEDLKRNYLLTETLKWFIQTRNETVKQKPFDLTKELVIDIYLPTGEIYSIKDNRLVVDVDKSFNSALNFIRSIFVEKFNFVEVFFTSTVIFRESGQTVDLYPKIKDGLLQMGDFLNALLEKIDCNCEICMALKKRSDNLFKKLQTKEMTFTTDYSLSDRLTMGIQADLLLSSDGKKYNSISSMRASLDNPIYKEVKSDLHQLFYKFISIHSVIFQMQQKKILPEFMVVYNDGTFRSMPFMVTVKSTFYRKVQEIINLPDFADVIAILYCGEYYYYDKEQWDDVCDKIYANRILKAQKVYLGFTMIVKDGFELSVSFDEEKVDDMEYVRKKISGVKKETKEIISSFDWLNPIRDKFLEEN